MLSYTLKDTLVTIPHYRHKSGALAVSKSFDMFDRVL